MKEEKKFSFIELMSKISDSMKLMDDFEKAHGELKYKGYLTKYIDMYKKEVLEKETEQLIKDNVDKEIIEDSKHQHDNELYYIELFCRWLDEEKKVKLK